MSKGIQSINVGFELLKTITEAEQPLSLSDLANRVSMSPSKARNYLVSFLETGLIAQTSPNGSYTLGPYALRLGLAALGNFDVLEIAYTAMDELTNSTGVASLLIVWTSDGPKVVAHRNGRTTLPVYFRIGTTPGLTYTGTGRIFLAYLPEDITKERIREELASNKKVDKFKHIDQAFLDARLKRIRKDGLAKTKQIILPDVSFEGFSTISAPIFDQQHQLASVLTAVIERSQPEEFVEDVEKSIREITQRISNLTANEN